MADNISAIRQNQIQQAEQNPNIISKLVGAPSPAPTGIMKAATAPQTYGQAYQTAGQYGQQLGKELYGQGGLQGLGQNIDAMTKELFNYDQQLEKAQTPFPQVQGFVPNPADYYTAMGAAAGTAGGGIGKTQSAVSSINTAYQNAIFGIVDKFLSYFSLAEQKREGEADRERQDRNTYLDRLIQIASRTPGGKKVEIRPGEWVDVPGLESEKKDTSVVEVGGRKKLIDNQTGNVIQDLGEATVSPNLFSPSAQGIQPTLGTTTIQGKKYYPPPMSAPAGVIQTYEGVTWKSLGNSKWQPVSSIMPILNLKTTGTVGESAIMKPPISSFWKG